MVNTVNYWEKLLTYNKTESVKWVVTLDVEEDFPVEEIESIMEVHNDDEIKFGEYEYRYKKFLK